jgi:tight adherence protein B
MSPTLVASLAFLATAILVGFAGLIVEKKCFAYREQTNQRLTALTTKSASNTDSGLFKGLNRTNGDRESWSTWLERCIEQAGLHYSPEALAGIAFLAATTAAAVALLASGRWWVAGTAGLCGLAVVPLYVRLKRQRRMTKLLFQLPQAMELITRAVSAGQTVPAAFRVVADELEPPIATTFRNCYERQNLGMSFDKSLRALARQTGIVELQILAVVLLVQSRTGGNLVELLRELTETVYKRLKFKQRVRALTSEGRLQAAVLIVLPTVAFVGLHFLSPDYVRTLHEHPKLIAATVLAQAVGALWIRNCIKCDF